MLFSQMNMTKELNRNLAVLALVLYQEVFSIVEINDFDIFVSYMF